MSTSFSSPELLTPPLANPVQDAVATAVREGLSCTPKWLPAWLFYDAEGSRLFERITTLPEYYPTRTERAIFAGYADGIIDTAIRTWQQTHPGRSGRLRILELGAGTATKTGILLDAAVRRQGQTEYLPVDVSESAMAEACASMERVQSGVIVSPQVANYVTDALEIPQHDGPTMALYIGSSIGNFDPEEAATILGNLRRQLQPGDTLLLGTDMVKDRRKLEAAYNDHDGVTEAFNLNLLRRINRDLRANFDLARYRHMAVWNEEQSRIEMHLQSLRDQIVRIPALNASFHFAKGETIHTENSYKFTGSSIASLLHSASYAPVEQWTDEQRWFAVTLATPE